MYLFSLKSPCFSKIKCPEFFLFPVNWLMKRKSLEGTSFFLHPAVIAINSPAEGHLWFCSLWYYQHLVSCLADTLWVLNKDWFNNELLSLPPSSLSHSNPSSKCLPEETSKSVVITPQFKCKHMLLCCQPNHHPSLTTLGSRPLLNGSILFPTTHPSTVLEMRGLSGNLSFNQQSKFLLRARHNVALLHSESKSNQNNDGSYHHEVYTLVENPDIRYL